MIYGITYRTKSGMMMTEDREFKDPAAMLRWLRRKGIVEYTAVPVNNLKPLKLKKI